MDRLISAYTYPFFAFYIKLYFYMICYGNLDNGIHMYYKQSNIVQR